MNTCYASFWVFLWLKKDSIKIPWRQWSILNAYERIKSRNHNSISIYPYNFRLNKAFVDSEFHVFSAWVRPDIKDTFCFPLPPRCNPFSFKINVKVKEGILSMEESYSGPSDSWNQIDTLQLQCVQLMHHKSDTEFWQRNLWSSSTSF